VKRKNQKKASGGGGDGEEEDEEWEKKFEASCFRNDHKTFCAE
jgi:hypothetical protein